MFPLMQTMDMTCAILKKNMSGAAYDASRGCEEDAIFGEKGRPNSL